MAIFDDSLSKITTLSLKITLPAAFFFLLFLRFVQLKDFFLLLLWDLKSEIFSFDVLTGLSNFLKS